MTSRFIITPSRALTDNRLSDTDLRVLMCIGYYADKHGWCFPSHKKMADEFGKSVSTLKRSITRLREFGYLQVDNRIVPGRGQTSNKYRVIMDADFEGEEHDPQSTDELGGRSPMDELGGRSSKGELPITPSLSPHLNKKPSFKNLNGKKGASGTVCFPVEGPIEFADGGKWARIARSGGSGACVEHIARMFREWCRKKPISLSAPNIESSFETFAKGVKP